MLFIFPMISLFLPLVYLAKDYFCFSHEKNVCIPWIKRAFENKCQFEIKGISFDTK